MAASLLLRAERDLAKCVKEATKLANRECTMDTSLNYHERYKFWFDMEKKKAVGAINGLCDLLEDESYSNAMDRLIGIMSSKANNTIENKQWYTIMIRPLDNKVDIGEFMSKVQSIITRKCFIEGSYSFEQKGKSPDELGNGMHVHICAKMKQASKGQVLRDIKSSLSKWLDDNIIGEAGIDIGVSKRPDDFIQKYLIEYESEDGHKVETQAMDELWRNMYSIKRIYNF